MKSALAVASLGGLLASRPEIYELELGIGLGIWLGIGIGSLRREAYLDYSYGPVWVTQVRPSTATPTDTDTPTPTATPTLTAAPISNPNPYLPWLQTPAGYAQDHLTEYWLTSPTRTSAGVRVELGSSLGTSIRGKRRLSKKAQA